MFTNSVQNLYGVLRTVCTGLYHMYLECLVGDTGSQKGRGGSRMVLSCLVWFLVCEVCFFDEWR